MKKTILTLVIILGITLGASAQNGGLFGKGPNRGYYDEYYDEYDTREGVFNFSLPNSHGETGDQNGTPLGSGALLLIGFGAAYVGLKRKNRK